MRTSPANPQEAQEPARVRVVGHQGRGLDSGQLEPSQPPPLPGPRLLAGRGWADAAHVARVPVSYASVAAPGGSFPVAGNAAGGCRVHPVLPYPGCPPPPPAPPSMPSPGSCSNRSFGSSPATWQSQGKASFPSFSSVSSSAASSCSTTATVAPPGLSPPPPPSACKGAIEVAGMALAKQPEVSQIRRLRDDGPATPEEHRTLSSYSTPSSGYLCVEAGEMILIRYWQGPDEWEAGGWCYGHDVKEPGRQGWLPQRVLEPARLSQ